MTTATMKPAGRTDTPGTSQAATSNPMAAEPRKTAVRNKSRITGSP
jgi:hypothetical protein